MLLLALAHFQSWLQPRFTLSLDGAWQVEEARSAEHPTRFSHTVQVPGLLSNATPPFEPIAGPKVADRGAAAQKDPARDAYWYRRTFEVPDLSGKYSYVKIAKALFGAKVYLNGKYLGEHLPCFTPGYFDIGGALRPGSNEIEIRLGADRDALGTKVQGGFDFEKSRYIPGIVDSVTLVAAGSPYIRAVQIAPHIEKHSAHVEAVLENRGPEISDSVRLRVYESVSGRLVCEQTVEPYRYRHGEVRTIEADLPIADTKLWSPEHPFLYRLQVETGNDSYSSRFGMREFRFDRRLGVALLNGRPYYLRGSNFCLYRFLEDPNCKGLPWTPKWVELLHRRVKEMNWNALRYCIGFPPESWYEQADEQGILIQDEFPIWGIIRDAKAIDIAQEYREWIVERWNHPSVVIWDAQNETITPETGEALSMVRSMDISKRPWDNGWSLAQLPTDSNESHDYHFQSPFARPDRVFNDPKGDPGKTNPSGNKGGNATLLNEYGWLWLNRDGSPTTLTKDLYANLLGENSTREQREDLYGRLSAVETEYWRSHRKAAGVMEFCSLSYSRPDGQTSDHWLDVEHLVWEPHFLKYSRDAFKSVGVCVDFYASKVSPGSFATIPVTVITDEERAVSGELTLRLRTGGDSSPLKVLSRQRLAVAANGRQTATFRVRLPKLQGQAELLADFRGTTSRRKFILGPPDPPNLAARVHISASANAEGSRAEFANDDNPATYWSSPFADGATLTLDFGKRTRFNKIVLIWETAHAKEFRLEVSNDGKSWKPIVEVKNGKGGREAYLADGNARYLRVNCIRRATQWGNAIREIEVYGRR